MARWEGDTRGRLERAALELFEEQGYDRTTVAQIARRANLTERSFYRWFADKREVLFAGDDLEAHLVKAIDAVPGGTAPLPTVLAALPAATDVFRPRDFLRRRAAVLAANPPLQERELIKAVSLSAAIAAALVRRGSNERTARMATDIAMAVMRSAAERWAADDDADFAEALTGSGDEMLTIVTTAASPAPE